MKMAETRERMRSFEDLGADGVIEWLKERDVLEDVQDLVAGISFPWKHQI